MSVQALGWVFDHSPTKGAERLVLLSIANHANKSSVDGAWEGWPGVETMRKEAGLDHARTVQAILKRLENAKVIDRVINGAPDTRIRGDRRPNLYRIRLDHGVYSQNTPSGANPEDHADGVNPEYTPSVNDKNLDGVYSHAPRGVLPRATGCTGDTPEPSVEPSVEPNCSLAEDSISMKSMNPAEAEASGSAASEPGLDREHAKAGENPTRARTNNELPGTRADSTAGAAERPPQFRSPPPRRPRQGALPREDVDRVAAHLAAYVEPLINCPAGELDTSSAKKWIDPIRLLLDKGPLGRRSPQPVSETEVIRVIDAVFTRIPFWSEVIRDGLTLRTKWDELVKRANPDKSSNGRSGRQTSAEAHDVMTQALRDLAGSGRPARDVREVVQIAHTPDRRSA